MRYRASSPGSPNLVEVGQVVRQGDTVGIIEVTAIRNPILAEVSGVVEAILVENGQPVDYGQALMTIV
ncbi:biotin/lipoyl-containing protein [Streptomyces sp. NPDC005900]|uniref:acetyl-CoA carboxylase biotin carboxyl carrier protein n=1 Tax=Streptomyces sp. NPDC005900 TaxID=3154569 RepID=UPI0033EF2594